MSRFYPKSMNVTALHSRIPLSGCLIFLFLSVCYTGNVAAEGANAAPDLPAQAIVERAVARAEAQHTLLIDSKFESQVFMSIKSLDNSGRVAETEETRYHQYPLQGALFEELIEQDGRALNAQERRAEEKNKAKFIREVEKRKKSGLHPQPEKRPGIRFGNQLMRRYRFKMVRTEEADRHRCWVIAFEPKDGELPVQEIMDRALNQSTGMLWVAQEDFGIVRFDFVMRKPFKYWAGLLAVIRNTEGRLDFQQVEPNVWLASNFALKLDINVMMVKNIRRLITKKWTDYKSSSRGGTSTIIGSVSRL
jgi:hypothetical protein